MQKVMAWLCRQDVAKHHFVDGVEVTDLSMACLLAKLILPGWLYLRAHPHQTHDGRLREPP